jgi:two-component sensor histidine kinase
MSITIQPGRSASRAARRFVHYAADQWLGQDRVSELLTVVTELVCNAAMHAQTPMVLNLLPRGDHVLVELYDGSSTPPRALDGAGAEIGLGLRLVDGVVQRWGVEVYPTGKMVWAEV